MKKSEKNKATDEKPTSFIFEKDFRTTLLHRLKRVLCLFLPIGAAFGGYFAAPPLWNLITKSETTPEGFKFALSLTFFAIITLIVFFKTRNTNPIMKIRVLMKE